MAVGMPSSLQRRFARSETSLLGGKQKVAAGPQQVDLAPMWAVQPNLATTHKLTFGSGLRTARVGGLKTVHFPAGHLNEADDHSTARFT